MAEQPTGDLISQRKIRLEKVKKLKDLGFDPYPTTANKDYKNQKLIKNFNNLKDEKYHVTGRIMSWRDLGKLIFINIQDSSGQIQLYIKKDTIQKKSNKEEQTLGWENLDLFDIGDIVQAYGKLMKTKTGEISILVEDIKMLTKAIRPLPDKWHGLKNKETIFRRRYLDMIMNPDKKWRFEKVAQIRFALREFLYSKDFLEIRTPIIQPVYGGTNAKPFTTHVNALDVDYYLAVSHELYLKRLITAGFDNVFNFVGYFRNEGIDRSHNPEFTMVETMTAYKNYEYNMKLTEEMYRYIAEKVFNKTKFKIVGEEVDFADKWERISMLDAVKKHSGYNFDRIELQEAHQILDEINFEEEKPKTVGECMVKVFEEKVEEKLIKPTFITGHPIEISPLAKAMPEDPRFAERFEIFIGGIEGGDNWTELNDPVLIYERFKDQVKRGRGGDDEFHPMDIEFVEMLEYGMPPTTGLGPGIERLAMMFTETDYIDDVIFFPMLKPAPLTKIQKDIYDEEYLTKEQQVSSKQENQTTETADNSTNYEINLDQIPNSNLAKLNSELSKKYPGIKFGYIILNNVKIEKANNELNKLKSEIKKKVKNKYSNQSDIKTSTKINGFRELYKSFGADPNSRKNSAEALISRIASNKDLYNINNLVDTYNLTSAELELPMAAYDLDQIKGNIMLTLSKEGDSIIKIGDKKPTQIDSGEIVYKDDSGVICMDFNYRDSERTKITKDTNRIIVFVDGHSGITKKEIEKTLALVGGRLEYFTGGKVIEKGYRNANTPKQFIERTEETSQSVKFTQDRSKKIVIVVNDKIENWKILNAVGHVSAYFGHKIDKNFFSGPAYKTKDGQEYQRSGQYPIIVLSANSSQLNSLQEDLKNTDVNYYEFLKEHLEVDKDEDIEKELSSKESDSLVRYAVGLFGDRKKVEKLTKKFSLWS